jgi:ribonuclease P protein component
LLRLKTRAQFQAVLSQRVIAKTEHFALHRHPVGGVGAGVALLPPSPATAPGGAADSPDLQERALFASSGLWLGAMVPKRWAKSSVTRHAIRRQIYELGTAMLAADDPAAYLVRLRAGFSRQQFFSSSSQPLKQAVRAELQALLARSGRAGPGGSPS